LARAYADQAVYAWAPYADAFEQARNAAQSALDLEPNLAEGHAALGNAVLPELEWKAAEASLRRAIALEPDVAVSERGGRPDRPPT